ncbi:ATP translocase [Sphingomonas sp. SRS2]|uniref:ATP translocase n=1 Tax=Sphingomonas sp. SRS2 TaxID=133190 RepID=UPI0006184347|nr:ATP translocase [Sphingomonas sp. SRS2]KKC26578.1 ATP translocase [Sphingomonas sp. SRS2]
MPALINRLLRVAPGELPKLAPFALLGFLLQMGLGIGFSAGDAAFLARAGADNLALIFMMTPAVMLLYTGVFSYLLVRYSLDRVVDATIGLLVVGGLLSYMVLGMALPPAWEMPVYFGLKLYLAMWYIALYSLFWNYTDAYFNIQDGKRLFPLLAAATAFGTTCGGLIVSELAGSVSLRGFFLIWSGIGVVTLPVAILLRRRWTRIADSDVDEGDGSVAHQVGQVATTFRTSRYTLVLTLVLFVTLLLTNLAEFQYSTVFQQGRSEAELASLLGKLYAAANIFNVFVCLFLFNRLVGRIGVRNVALIMPLSYFAAFGFLFVTGSFEGALAAFFVYHGVLTSIEYNNQNMLFNAVPSATKRPVRTIVEGMAEPLASFIAGGFLLLAADRMDMRELSGIGVILGVVLLLIVILLRQLYPAAMARNMQAMLLGFGQRAARPTPADPEAAPASTDALLNRLRSPDRAERERAMALLRAGRDIEAVPQILSSAAWLGPRERHAIEHLIADWGDTAIPRLVADLGNPDQHPISRALAARTLAKLSLPLFTSRLDTLVRGELDRAQPRFALAEALEALPAPSRATRTLARFHRQQVGTATDFAIELLAIGGRLPDFDLLVVSLHSKNAKVRANAIEAIENGVDRSTFLMLKELIDGRPAASSGKAPLLDLLDARLASTNPIELVATAQAIRDIAPPAELGPRLRKALRPGIGRTARNTIATLLELDGAPDHTLVDRIDAIAAIPEFAPATIEVHTRLAMILHEDKPGADAIPVAMPDSRLLWLPRSEVIDFARRYADLALSMYRATDGRTYAA